jgi:hypothetical protein
MGNVARRSPPSRSRYVGGYGFRRIGTRKRAFLQSQIGALIECVSLRSQIGIPRERASLPSLLLPKGVRLDALAIGFGILQSLCFETEAQVSCFILDGSNSMNRLVE